MPMSEAESKFLRTLAGLIPSAPGYRPPEARSRTDDLLRDHVASELARLRGRIGELKAAASGEGEEDMVGDLDQIDARMVWAIEALRGAEYGGLPFFAQSQVPDGQLARVCAYDQELLDDLALLAADVLNLKYETIGNLTLREAEGTMAAIEMKIANRAWIFEADGES
jgi:hypothetical protein